MPTFTKEGAGDTTPENSGDSSEVQKIKLETERIKAETEKQKAEWDLTTQQAGFKNIEEYQKALASVAEKDIKLASEKLEWEHQKTLENSERQKDKAQFDQQKEQLRKVYEELKTREKNITEREKLCSEREGQLDEAQKVKMHDVEIFNSDLETLKREFKWIRNRFGECANLMIDDYGGVLWEHIGLIDRQGQDIQGNYDKLVSNLKTMMANTDSQALALVNRRHSNGYSKIGYQVSDILLTIYKRFHVLQPPSYVPDEENDGNG